MPAIPQRLLLSILTLLLAQEAQATVWYVHPGESIEAAIKAARAGDTVKVERAYYHEHLVIDKALILQGIDRPTISGDNLGDVIRVKSPDVRIEGFIVRDSGSDLTAQNAGIYIQPGADRAAVVSNAIVYSLFGMWIEGVKKVVIANNNITGKRDFDSPNRGNGIQLYNTDGAQIIGNNISFTRDGIYVDVSNHAIFRGNKIHNVRYGTHYMNSNHNLWENNESYFNRGGLALMMVKDNTVRGNKVWGNSDHGIMLRTMQDSLVENNIVSGNSRGFFVYDAEFNVLRNNLVIGNHVGIHLWAGSIHNQVYGNDFIANRDQIRYVAARDENWGGKVGNYWSNYLGWDRDGDGIGDIPYEASDVVDRLTWRNPMTKLLLNSPAVQTLRMVARQFPLFRSPSIVDTHPHMQPFFKNWSTWLDKQRH
ncbi:MAG: nitrous oxide reductase family maturation protein NosD [Burkholderiales bacterium]